MKKIIVAIFLLVLPATAFSLGAENKRLGVGLNLGEPIGYNARFFFFDQLAADLTIGYGFAEQAFIIQPSALFYLRRILDYNGKEFSLVPYFGAGLKTGVDISGRNDGQGIAAMRFPVGAAFVLKEGVFEASVEFAPGVEFTPDSGFDGTGGIGLRYYFW